MKEFTNFTLGIAYTLSWVALLKFRSFHLPLSNEYVGYGTFIAFAMIFIIVSIVYLTVLYLSMIHDVLRKASQ